MHFEENFTYHVYNRSNQIVFKTTENYLYFLRKFREYIFNYVDVLAWCLMPNHFHFMLSPNKEATILVKEKHLPNTQLLSKQFGTLLSSYTKAFNKQNGRKGSLFAHNTNAKQLNQVAKHLQGAMQLSYAVTCFRYIHLNPVESNLVKTIKDWEFSSFKDFANNRNGNLINRDLAMRTVNYDSDNFERWSSIDMNDDDINNIF